jgi:hypothetical protein
MYSRLAVLFGMSFLLFTSPGLAADQLGLPLAAHSDAQTVTAPLEEPFFALHALSSGTDAWQTKETLTPLADAQLATIEGGWSISGSIYIDGMYWGQGRLDGFLVPPGSGIPCKGC